ncbi:hypothetical protein L3Q82_026789, partial [Scortum barcoo]
KKEEEGASSKDGLAPSVSRPLSNSSLCGMNWIDQSQKMEENKSLKELLEKRQLKEKDDLLRRVTEKRPTRTKAHVEILDLGAQMEKERK